MSALYNGIVTHKRFSPKPHLLKYRVFSLLLDLATLDEEAGNMRLFSRNRFNLFSFHDRDYGDGRGNPLAWAQEQMRAAGLGTEGSRITLLAMPRLLGYAFNPIVVYFCYAADDTPRAILYEVNNTFGQRHSYFIPVEALTDGVVRQSCSKAFYVSPFMDMDLRYDFTLRPPAETLRLRIAASDARGVVLTASLSGRRVALNDAALLRAAAAYPALTVKVVLGIYWEALRLWLKGMRVRARPSPPAEAVTFNPGAGRST
jgi:uncharacterized protein